MTSPLPDRRLTMLSVVLALGALVTLLDTTIVNVALHRLQVEFGSSVADTQWVSTGYLLAFVAVIPLSGWLSERIGARNAWLLAIAVFLIGSALCGVAGTLPELIGFRVVQGLGGGMVVPITMGIMTQAAGPERVERAMLAIALPAALGPILGSVLGGVIVESWDWHWVFLVNVPVCVVALAVGYLVLPRVPGQREQRFDVLGFALLTPGVVAIAFGVSRSSGDGGFAAASAWGPLVAGGVLLALFTLHALRTTGKPLIDVRVFARRSFGVGSLITFMSGFSLYALTLVLPLYYQVVRGESVLATGLLLIPQSVGTMLYFGLIRKFTAHLDGRVVVGGGVVLMMIGVLPFALSGAGGQSLLLIAGQFVLGIGFGASTFPVLSLALAGLSHEEAPRGSAAFSVVQRVGSPLGVAVLATILQSRLNGATTPENAFTTTFWWALAFSAIPLLVVPFLPGRSAASTGESSPAASLRSLEDHS
ncbi:MDR family MFS transporter [Winogradskya consettensis]|uniref:MFS transporter n=1 Tax=Winogradskya consettensis TaxID=113560 RepID=A0A919SYE8_9ACTN|nr:MDR family MFS transporter [Actinoplanes consettensis]GIM81001.1 MFS transporter [Actinoplanes consettensis]